MLCIPDKMLKVVISFYRSLEAYVISDNESFDLFTVTTKTKQGYVFFCSLFQFDLILYSEIIILALSSKFVLKLGYLIISGSKLRS